MTLSDQLKKNMEDAKQKDLDYCRDLIQNIANSIPRDLENGQTNLNYNLPSSVYFYRNRADLVENVVLPEINATLREEGLELVLAHQGTTLVVVPYDNPVASLVEKIMKWFKS